MDRDSIDDDSNFNDSDRDQNARDDSRYISDERQDDRIQLETSGFQFALGEACHPMLTKA